MSQQKQQGRERRMRVANRGDVLARNTVALSMGRMASKVLVFFMVRFYTFALTNAEYGQVDLVSGLCNLLIPLACAGLSGGFFRFAAEAGTQGEREAVFSSGLRILLISTGVFLLLSPLLLISSYFSRYVWVIILYVLSANLHYFCSDFVRAQGSYTLFAVQGLLNTLLNILFNILFLLPFDMGVEGYLLSIVIANWLTTLFLVVYCRLWRYVRPRAGSRTLALQMLRFCLPLIPATLCWWITNTSDHYMVQYFWGDAADGLYAVAYKIPNLLVICGTVFMEAWQFSAVVENKGASGQESAAQRAARLSSVTEFFGTVYRGYVGLLIPAAGMLMLLTKPLARVLFDPSFYDAWVYVPTLLGAVVLSSLAQFANSACIVEKRSTVSFYTAALGAALNIALNLWLIPLHGALGAAVATLISYGALFVTRLAVARRIFPFRISYLRMTANTVLLTALMAVVTLQLPWHLLLSVCLELLLLLLNLPPLIANLTQWLRQRRQRAVEK